MQIISVFAILLLDTYDRYSFLESLVKTCI